MTNKNTLITGASGLIGTRLTELLLERGYTVAHLGRSAKSGKVKSFVWNVNNFTIDPDALKGITTIIHLAGAGVADKRWTDKRKREILDSRINATALLFKELQRGGHNVTTVISASAIGYYGFEDNETLFTETHAPGNDFLAQVTKRWEAEVEKIKSLNLRVVKLRIGIVLSEKGGALQEMVKPVKLFAGSSLGSGNQQVSWIHIDDLCNMFIKAAEDEKLNDTYNAVGPYPVSNKDLTKAIAQTLHRPLLLPSVPPFALKLILGEMSDVVLGGSKVSSQKIQQTGFEFQFKSLEGALQDLLLK